MSDMKMMKVAELTGSALDWVVGQADEGGMVSHESGMGQWRDSAGNLYFLAYTPSTDWAHCGPIFEQVGAVVKFGSEWHAYLTDGKAVRSSGYDTTYMDVDSGKDDSDGVGDTPLVAVCRAFVSGRMGEQVKIPIELANPL